MSRFQKFEAVEVHRSELKGADYNPRTIDKYARKKLLEKIRKVGLVETLVWNKRTGNLVGGHQRIGIMDDLEGTQDYRLTVAAVDVDDKTEREMNVFLNNGSAQGAYDLDALKAMLDTVELEEIGFDAVELQLMFPDEEFSKSLIGDDNDRAAPDIAKLKELDQREKERIKKAREAEDPEFILTVVFNDRKECDAFLDGAGFPGNEKYIDGRRLAALMDIELGKSPASPSLQTA